tara:strand:- start:17 stop:478 length:462 start_codon:yes stop_codon:yes gene_type:complete
MYAVIKSGGKQHRVEEGEFLRVEKLDVATGEKIQFDEVLMVTDGEKVKIGTPYISGAKVTAEILSHGRADKIRIIKFNRRKHSRKQMGHRQWFTEIKILSISATKSKVTTEIKTKLKAKTVVEPKAKSAVKPKSKVAAKVKAVTKPKIKPEEK